MIPQTKKKQKNTEDEASVDATKKGEDNILKIFGQASVWLPNNETDISASPFWAQLMKDTGVQIDLTATSGDVQQQFNLMVAGGKENLPDIIFPVQETRYV